MHVSQITPKLYFRFLVFFSISINNFISSENARKIIKEIKHPTAIKIKINFISLPNSENIAKKQGIAPTNKM